jgi:hypothetical protein
MKKLMIALVAVLAVTLVARYAVAADTQKISGILIDEKCGNKDGKPKSEADAAKHPQACVLKCAKGGSALQIISGDKAYKLDEASTAKALEYLAAEKGEGATRVAVEGTVKDDTLTITSIKRAERKEA